jgi:G3E family GTPase
MVAEQLSFDELLVEHDHDDHAGHRHLHDDYASVSFISERALDPRKLIGFLEDPPPGLFRAKGFAAFGVADERRKFVLHMVGRHIVFEPGGWSRGEARGAQLVLIGAGLRTDTALARLHDTVHDAAEPLDAQSMLGVWRYTPH